jgi:2-oxoisovalerate dehydrogenase E1 component alpha subunit
MSLRSLSRRIPCSNHIRPLLRTNGSRQRAGPVSQRRRRSVALTPTAERYVYLLRQCSTNVLIFIRRVLFPGALNSKFTDSLKFIRPAEHEAIPTYRVMNQNGDVLNKDEGVDTSDEEALELYRNMVCRMYNHGVWRSAI